MEEHSGAIVTVVLVVVTIGIVVFLLAKGIANEEPLAFSIAILMWTVIAFSSGVGFTLTVQQIQENREARRFRQEQEHFRTNTAENLALMGAVAKVQTEQTRAQSTHTAMLLRQNREQGRLLAPSGNGDAESGGFPFDEADFLELED